MYIFCLLVNELLVGQKIIEPADLSIHPTLSLTGRHLV